MRIAIVGAGVAGLAAATLLARSGHEVTVFERQPAMPAARGGLLLQPCGLHVLSLLDLQDEVRQRGSRITQIVRQRASGEVTARLDYHAYRPGSHALGITRNMLVAAMGRRAAACAVEIVSGCTVTAIREDGAAAMLDTATGGSIGPFAAVVVADGTRSRLRTSLGLDHKVEDCTWGTLSVTLPRPKAMTNDVVRQWFRQGPDVVGVLPSGRDEHDRECVTWFQDMTAAQYSADDRMPFAQWREQALSVSPDSEELLMSLHGFDALQFSRYATVAMPCWSTNRCVVIGDAAHALDPLLGMGANMALVDAATLAETLSVATERTLAPALRQFQSLRSTQITRYQRAGRVLRPLLRADQTLSNKLPDLILRAALWTPAGRRQIMAAVCGDQYPDTWRH